MTLPEKRLFSEIQFDSQQLASMVHVLTWTQSTVPSNFPQPLQTWTHEMAMSGTKKLPRRRAKGDDRIRLMVPHCVRRERGERTDVLSAITRG